MMAVKDSIPIIPRFEMVNDPPWYSLGFSFPSRAFPASVFVKAEMEASPSDPASTMIGVMSPVGVATAIEISCLWNLNSRSQRNIPNTIREHSPSHKVSMPSRVDFRNVLQRRRTRLDDEIVDRKLDSRFDPILDSSADGLRALGGSVEDCSELVDSVHVDLRREVVVRDGRFRFG